jgi:hypothetical protein
MGSRAGSLHGGPARSPLRRRGESRRGWPSSGRPALFYGRFAFVGTPATAVVSIRTKNADPSKNVALVFMKEYEVRHCGRTFARFTLRTDHYPAGGVFKTGANEGHRHRVPPPVSAAFFGPGLGLG